MTILRPYVSERSIAFLSRKRLLGFGLTIVVFLCVGLKVAKSDDWNDFETRKIQEALIWTTHYDGLVDGKMGKRTTEAIGKFQTEVGHAATGNLSSNEHLQLLKLGTEKRAATGFAQFTDHAAGVSVGIPHALLSGPKPTKLGKSWYNREAGLAIDTLRLDSDISFNDLFVKLKTMNSRRVSYERYVDNDWFVIAAFEGDAAVYVRANLVSRADQKPEIRGFSVWMSKNRPSSYQAIPPAMLSSFRWNTDTRNDASTNVPIVPAKSEQPPVLVVNPPPRAIATTTGSPSSAKNCLNGLGDCLEVRSLGFR